MTPSFIGPVVSAVLMLVGWLSAQSRDEHGLPRRIRVHLGEWIAMTGLVLGLLTLPRDIAAETYVVALVVLILMGLLLIRGAGRLAIGWTTVAETITAAAGLSWTRPGRVLWSLLCLIGGLTLAMWLASQGHALAGLLGAAVVLAPVRWHLHAGYSRERTQTGIERALAGTLRGGAEWDSHQAALRGAPVRIRYDSSQRPARITMPLPPSWDEEPQQIAKRVQRRLKTWGRIWRVDPDDSGRFLVVTPGEKLPSWVDYDGSSVDGLTVTLGLARLSEAAGEEAEPGEDDYLGRPGDLVPFRVNLADTPAGLIVGTMGGGKSVLVRLLIVQWCQRYPAVLIDPKRVEMTPFRGRHNVAKVAKELEDIAETFEAMEAEMDRRYEMMERAGVQHIKDLPNPPPDILFVVDEYYELIAKSPGSDDESKAVNDLKARCANAARRIPALGRAAGLHPFLLAQAAYKDVVKGDLQNNLRFRALMRPKKKDATARSMIGLTEAEITGAPRGRALMMTDAFPESEVQVPYVDVTELDRYLPRWEDGGRQPYLSALLGNKGDDDAVSDDEPETDQTTEKKPTKRSKKQKSDGDSKADDDEGQSASQADPDDDPSEPDEDPSDDDLDFDLSDFEDDPK